MKLRNYLFYLLGSIILLGCAHSPENEYYLVQASTTKNPNSLDKSISKSLLIRKVNLASYLDRLNLVTFQENGKLKIDDFHLWAEPLDSNIRSVLAQDLGNYLAATQVYDQKTNAVSNPDFVLDAFFLNIDNKHNQTLHCKTQWTLTIEKNKHSSFGNFEVFLPMTGGNHKAAVDTIGHCLDLLAKDIANRVTQESYRVY